MIGEYLIKHKFKCIEQSNDFDIYKLDDCIVKVGYPNIIIDIGDNFEGLLLSDNKDIIKDIEKLLKKQKVLI